MAPNTIDEIKKVKLSEFKGLTKTLAAKETNRPDGSQPKKLPDHQLPLGFFCIMVFYSIDSLSSINDN